MSISSYVLHNKSKTFSHPTKFFFLFNFIEVMLQVLEHAVAEIFFGTFF